MPGMKVISTAGDSPPYKLAVIKSKRQNIPSFLAASHREFGVEADQI